MSIDIDHACPECGSPMFANKGLDEGEAYCSTCDYREPFVLDDWEPFWEG